MAAGPDLDQEWWALVDNAGADLGLTWARPRIWLGLRRRGGAEPGAGDERPHHKRRQRERFVLLGVERGRSSWHRATRSSPTRRAIGEPALRGCRTIEDLAGSCRGGSIPSAGWRVRARAKQIGRQPWQTLGAAVARSRAPLELLAGAEGYGGTAAPAKVGRVNRSRAAGPRLGAGGIEVGWPSEIGGALRRSSTRSGPWAGWRWAQRAQFAGRRGGG